MMRSSSTGMKEDNCTACTHSCIIRYLVLRFRNDVRVMLPPGGRWGGHLRAPFDGPRSWLIMQSVWYGQTSTEKVSGADSTAPHTRPGEAVSLPSRQSHWGSGPCVG